MLVHPSSFGGTSSGMTSSKTSLSRGRRVGALVTALALTTALSAGCGGGGEDEEGDGGVGTNQDEDDDD